MKFLKTIICLIILIHANCFRILSKKVNEGDANLCNNNNDIRSGGHFRKHVSECYGLDGNISGGVTGPNDNILRYSGQTLILKDILDQIGEWVNGNIAITKVGSKILELHYQGKKLIHINAAQSTDFRFRIFTGENYQNSIQCKSDEDYKKQ